MSSNEKIDRRVLRTKRALQQALKELMTQKPYKKIKVSEIVVRADVARPTFYLHFETKDDLLLTLFDDVFAGFKSKLTEELNAPNIDFVEIAITMFHYWDQNSTTFKLLLDAEIDPMVLNQIKQCVAEAFVQINERQIQGTPPPQMQPYVIDSIAGSLFMILSRWIREEKQLDAENVGRFFGSHVLHQMLGT